MIGHRALRQVRACLARLFCVLCDILLFSEAPASPRPGLPALLFSQFVHFPRITFLTTVHSTRSQRVGLKTAKIQKHLTRLINTHDQNAHVARLRLEGITPLKYTMATRIQLFRQRLRAHKGESTCEPKGSLKPLTIKQNRTN